MRKIDAPVYINMVFHEFCDDCRHCDLEASSVPSDGWGGSGNTVHTLTCTRFEFCDEITYSLRRKYEKQNDRSE